MVTIYWPSNVDLRPKLLRYQKEAADVLYAAFLDEFGVIEPGGEMSEQGLTPAEQSYQQAQLLANLARQQLALEREVGNAVEQVAEQHEILALHEERLGQLELTLGTNDKITEAQATEIKEAVKAIGMLKAEQTGKERNNDRGTLLHSHSCELAQRSSPSRSGTGRTTRDAHYHHKLVGRGNRGTVPNAARGMGRMGKRRACFNRDW
jgi:hypothetical protein